MPLSRYALYLRTLRHLKPSQIGYMLWRRLGPRPPVPALPGRCALRRGLRAQAFLDSEGCLPNASTFRFLNNERAFDPAAMDWRAEEMPKLWCYNLHYFDFLTEAACSPELGGALIDSWIAGNPPGGENAWEPYALSKRIVNWCKFILRQGEGMVLPELWARSLHQQAAYLMGDLEYHILANHFFKNAMALVFAGVLLEGPEAATWRRKGLQILRREIPEQFLADGGHYERSLTYHAVMLEDLLDLINLGESAGDLLPAGDRAQWRETALSAVGFFADLLYPDGEIPLFNDAAFGIAPAPSRLRAYAARILGPDGDRAPSPDGPIVKAETGYYGVRHGGDMLLVDCGPMGPDYQPGHGHCDLLSYELCYDGRRFVVDSGVFGYDVGEMRHRIRSTAAHNTLRIDSAEQSEIWHAFRVGRRARVLAARWESDSADAFVFTGAHDGYRHLPGAPRHERLLRFERDGGLEVEDRILGKGQHLLESFLHIHPDYEAIEESGGFVFRTRDGERQARLQVAEGCRAALDSGYFCPYFGVAQVNPVIVLRHQGPLPATLRYRIDKHSD